MSGYEAVSPNQFQSRKDFFKSLSATLWYGTKRSALEPCGVDSMFSVLRGSIPRESDLYDVTSPTDVVLMGVISGEVKGLKLIVRGKLLSRSIEMVYPPIERGAAVPDTDSLYEAAGMIVEETAFDEARSVHTMERVVAQPGILAQGHFKQVVEPLLTRAH